MARPDSGQFEQLGRLERSGAEDDLLSRPHHVALAALEEDHAERPSRLRVDDDPGDRRAHHDVEVVPARGATQVALGSGPALTVLSRGMVVHEPCRKAWTVREKCNVFVKIIYYVSHLCAICSCMALLQFSRFEHFAIVGSL